MLENENNEQRENENNQEQEQQVNNEQLQQQLQEAQDKLNKLNLEIKNQNINKTINKLQIKPEFYDYVKFKIQNISDNEIENEINKLLKEQPELKNKLNTVGNKEVKEVVVTNKTAIKNNSLLDYKKKNYL